MERAQLVFIPFPAMGHLVSTVEFAKLLLNHDLRLSISVLIIKLPADHYDPNIDSYTQSVSASTSLSNRIRFVWLLPKDETEMFSFSSFLKSQIPSVKQAVSNIIQSEFDSPRLVGFVLNMFSTAMIDVANEFGVPSYIFFASGAAYLGLCLHMQDIFEEQKVDPAELMESATELSIPSLVNRLPAKALPQALLSKEWFPILLYNHGRFKEAKGIVVNTFFELESYAIESFLKGKFGNTTAVYPVGPILNVGYDQGRNKQQEIIEWLDDQPASSVVFLCFGSKGAFDEEQVKEIAYALEHCGHRFLWSLRRSSAIAKVGPTRDYENLHEVLPKGFLDRTTEVGKIIGWAPQATILEHQAVGGFVCHCGWNSILESIWYGVPVATWPIHSEQQFNAFEMVIELELAEEIRIDYTPESGIVTCDEIEKGIRHVMKQDSEKRKKVQEVSEKSRRALTEGGSSYIWLDCLVKNLMENTS